MVEWDMALFEKKGWLFLFLFLLVFSFFLYWGERVGFLVGIKGFLSRPFVLISIPFKNMSFNVYGFFSFVVSWPSREEEMTVLRRQLAVMSVDEGRIIELEQENQRLKDLLSSPLPPSWKFAAVKVIGWGENLRVNAGSSLGLSEGMTVVVNNVLVGRILKTNHFDSLVELVDKNGVKIPVAVKAKDSKNEIKAKGLLVGLGQNRLRLEKVLQEEKIAKGDLVVSLGEAGLLPDLLIGRIDEVSSDKTAVYQTALVLPLVDSQRLREVFVVYHQ